MKFVPFLAHKGCSRVGVAVCAFDVEIALRSEHVEVIRKRRFNSRLIYEQYLCSSLNMRAAC